MKNSLNKCIFLNILFLMGVLTTVDIYAARPNSKRASRSKSSTPTKKKTSLSSSSETTTVVESSEDRSANGTVTARPGRVTMSTTSSSAVDDDTAAELLASNLLACLQSPCYGDVPYEKCFSNGSAESYTRANTTCLGMYNGAANDVIKVKAMNQVNTKIRSYFADSCETAGGRISGNTCKIRVCYQAKAGSHHSPTKCMEYNVGKQVTCSYNSFGLSQQDLEYKEDMTSEQLGTIVQAGMQTLSGLLETGVAVVDAVQASKKLKSGSKIQGKKCWGTYTYGNEITGIECLENWELCGKDGKKKECEGKCPAPKTDTAGNYYCVSPSGNSKPSSTSITQNYNMADLIKPTSSEDMNISISGLSNLSWGAGLSSSGSSVVSASRYCKSLSRLEEGESCWAEFDEWSEVAVKEQEASLYKKFTNFTKLKIQEKIDTMKQGAMYAGLEKKVSKFGESTSVSCSTSVGYKQNIDADGRLIYKSSMDMAATFNKNNSEIQVNPSQCVEYQGEYFCKLSGETCKNAVKQKDGYYLEQEYNYDEGIADLTSYTETLERQLLEDNGKNRQTLSSATETFNSMQKEVNKKKQEITSLQEKKDNGIQKAISSGAQTLTTAGSTMTMAIVNANNNIGNMTGSCYIGDPAQGGIYLMSENEVKKLTWKNL